MPQNFNIDKALDAMKAKKVPNAKNLNVSVFESSCSLVSQFRFETENKE